MKILRILPLCFFYILSCLNTDAASPASPDLFESPSQPMDTGVKTGTHHTLIVDLETGGITSRNVITFPIDPSAEFLHTVSLEQLTRVHPTFLALAGIKASLEASPDLLGSLTLECDGPLRKDFYESLAEIIETGMLLNFSLTMVFEDAIDACLQPLYTAFHSNYGYGTVHNLDSQRTIITAHLPAQE